MRYRELAQPSQDGLSRIEPILVHSAPSMRFRTSEALGLPWPRNWRHSSPSQPPLVLAERRPLDRQVYIHKLWQGITSLEQVMTETSAYG